MTLIAKDEYCFECEQYHPRWLDGCQNNKTNKIIIMKSVKERMIQLSCELNQSGDVTAEFRIVRCDDDYQTVYLKYINPKILYQIKQHGFQILNVSPHSIKQMLVIGLSNL